MMRGVCERDSELLTALRAGAVPDDLRMHVQHCGPCQTTQRAASLLLVYAETMTARAEPPSAATVWRRAHERRRKVILRRAARGMLAMRAMGAVYVLGAMVWVLRTMWQAQSEQGREAMLALTSGTTSLGLGAALLLLMAGVLSLMFCGQRQSGTLLQ